MSEKDGAFKRHYEQDNTLDDSSTTASATTKRFKLNTATSPTTVAVTSTSEESGDKAISQEPTYERTDDHTLYTHGERSALDTNEATSAKNEQDDTELSHRLPLSSTSESPFALHPILDGLTNKSLYPSEPSGMRMSMSTILTETGRAHQHQSSLSPSSSPKSTAKALAYSARGQSLPPVSEIAQQQKQEHQQQRSQYNLYHRPASTSSTERMISSPTSLLSVSPHQYHQRSSSHPTIASMTHVDETVSPSTSKPVVDEIQPPQRQSITNEQLVRALTTSIPMENGHTSSSTFRADKDTQESPSITKTEDSSQMNINTFASSPMPTSSSSPSTTTTTTTTATTAAAAGIFAPTPSLPDLGAALRRLSGAALMSPDQQRKKDDVSPTEILGSALAAVARSQHGASTTAAAAAIGNLAALTANISHLLNANSAHNNDNREPFSPRRRASSTTTTTPSVSREAATASSPLLPPPSSSSPYTSTSIPSSPSTSSLQHGDQHRTSDITELNRRRSSGNHVPSSHTIMNMLDQATAHTSQPHQLSSKQEEPPISTPAHQHESLDGMIRAAAAAVYNASSPTATSGVPSSSNATINLSHPASSSNTPSLNRLHHNINRKTSPSASFPNSLLIQHPPTHHPHHLYHPPPHGPPSFSYGQMMYLPSRQALTPPTSTTKLPKLIVKNDQVWQAVKGKKETCLGFYLYHPSMLLPNLQNHLNGVVQVRIPARYLTYQNPKVKKRAVWGTDIYTDDSDIVTMAIHSGKYVPDYHEPELGSNDPFLLAVAGKTAETIRAASRRQAMSPKTYLRQTSKDDTIPEHDIKVTLRVLPKLQQYASTIQHHIKSRSWGGNHDGVSFYIENVEQLKKGEARPGGRSSLKSNLFRHYRKQQQSESFTVHREHSDTTSLSPLPLLPSSLEASSSLSSS